MLEIQISSMVAASIVEDVGAGDISAQLLPGQQIATATVIAREDAVVCGVSWVDEVFSQIDPTLQLSWQVSDGDRVTINQPWVFIRGAARSIVTGERCALNWLQTLSGTATLTAKYVAQVAGASVQLFDTRKTLPGLRAAQKYAVRCGGGNNHRMGLYDAYLIKENHIISCGGIQAAILQARQQQPHKPIEIEVEDIEELEQALAAKADIIMLDNFDLATMRQAVVLNAGRAQLEVSGNVDLTNIKEIAATGVQRISVGALTKHIQAIDLSLRLQND